MISSEEYKFITDQLGEAQIEGEEIAYKINDAKTTLENNELSNDNFIKNSLISVFSNAYNVAVDNHENISPSMENMIVELQVHVLENYGSIDLFLSDNNKKVSPDFAVVSERLGYPIDPINVE